MSKKLINHPDDCVDEALEGLVMTNPGLLILGKQRVVVHESVCYCVRCATFQSNLKTLNFAICKFAKFAWNLKILIRYIFYIFFSSFKIRAANGRVAVIAGGGAGHEPYAAGRKRCCLKRRNVHNSFCSPSHV